MFPELVQEYIPASPEEKLLITRIQVLLSGITAEILSTVLRETGVPFLDQTELLPLNPPGCAHWKVYLRPGVMLMSRTDSGVPVEDSKLRKTN